MATVSMSRNRLMALCTVGGADPFHSFPGGVISFHRREMKAENATLLWLFAFSSG
jgi:hypothetical protein